MHYELVGENKGLIAEIEKRYGTTELVTLEYTLKLQSFLKQTLDFEATVWWLNCIPNFLYTPILSFERGRNQQGLFIYQAYISFDENTYGTHILSQSMFSGDFVPEVSVETVLISKKEIDVLTIYNSYNVPFFLRSKSRKYHSIVVGYIYSRKNDRNTPISENSSMQQIELLWKKRLGLLSPPLEQIISRMRNKSEWQELGDIYYNIFNPDFKIKEEWDQEEYKDYKREYYSYNQYNESTNYINLYILCWETVLKEFQVVILDSGRYKTPAPTWGFIHDPTRYSESLYAYKYIS